MNDQPFAPFSLPAVLDTSAAASLRAALLSLRGRPIGIDASGVQKAGALSLQVLVSARITWAADRVAMRVDHPTAHFSEALTLAGISAKAEGTLP